MFDKYKFRALLIKLMEGATTVEFAKRTGFNRTYISKYLNLRLDKPPSPAKLKGLTGKSVSYEELMTVCGHFDGPDRNAEPIKIPVVGCINAGMPVYAAENIEGYESVLMEDVGLGDEFFYLRVSGNSMINARIRNGDLVFVRKQDDVESGEIAVVMVDDETATLKRVIKKQDLIILQPENPEYSPLIFSSGERSRVRILGKVVHVKFKV